MQPSSSETTEAMETTEVIDAGAAVLTLAVGAPDATTGECRLQVQSV
jgi:hypothetical protein